MISERKNRKHKIIWAGLSVIGVLVAGMAIFSVTKTQPSV